ncbi:MAG TPA: ABC transporter permease [Candidatus Acidoferrales bacterium]|nr:ABC transporter permease [Candidatus Acidoferrales bacterium]
MKLYRIFALIERDMRKFFRNPALMMASMIFPLVQLVVLGYAFGGKITNVKVGLVNQDKGVEALDVLDGLKAIEQDPRTFNMVNYANLPEAMTDLRAGFMKAVIYIPPDYSQRVLKQQNPRIAFIEDNTDTFTASGIGERIQQLQSALNGPTLPPTQPGESPISALSNTSGPGRLPASIDIQTVEVYPYIEYIKYLLAGSISLAIFVTAMIGGGITFIDDKARGLHEGYLTTPLSKVDLVLGLIGSGAIKGLMAGLIITIIGGLIAGIARIWEPVRLFYLIVVLAMTSLAMISFMFLLMVRVNDPLVPRAIFGVLNTLLFFPSGAIYPTAGFPIWLRWISTVDPFTYVVDALKNLLLKDTGFAGIYLDIGILAAFSAVLITGCIALFKRQI